MRKILYINILLALMFSMLACVDSEYDNNVVKTPADTNQISPKKVLTLRQFNDSITLGKFKSDTVFRKDYYLKGVVISSDRESNFYKELWLQDTLGGSVKISIDRYGVFLDFWLGNTYYIKIKGLSYNSTYKSLCVFSGVDTRLPGLILEDYIIWGGKPTGRNVINPIKIKFGSYSTAYVGRLVTFDSVQIKELGQTFAFPNEKDSKGSKDCSLQISTFSATLRNSSYATFARDTIKSGFYSITGVLTDDKVIVIRSKDKDIVKK